MGDTRGTVRRERTAILESMVMDGEEEDASAALCAGGSCPGQAAPIRAQPSPHA